MSGTSLDGVDIALVDIANGGQLRFLSAQTVTYPVQLHDKLQTIISQQSCSLKQLGCLDIELAVFISEHINLLLKNQQLKAADITAIGNHGHTLYHHPDDEFAFSLQIGNNNTISELTGITTIGDFRQRDIAAGGQGAPLVPAFHQQLFTDAKQNRVIVNIGGISNITFLPSDNEAEVIGFDTGPGNGLSNLWIQQHKGQQYDKDGEWAASGHSQQKLLDKMLQDPYLQQAIPKSTGREYFNSAWLSQQLASVAEDIAPQDVQATLIEFTAQTISQHIKQFCSPCQAIYLCGGGVHNPVLVSRLKALNSPITVASTSELGLDPDWVEACAFAWLAFRTLHGLSGNLASVTGAKKAVTLGAIYSSSDNS